MIGYHNHLSDRGVICEMTHIIAYIGLAAVFTAVSAISVLISDLPYSAGEKKPSYVRAAVWTSCLTANAAVLFLLHLIFNPSDGKNPARPHIPRRGTRGSSRHCS